MIPYHPLYVEDELNWLKYRRTFEGGRTFINAYLERYSDRETETEFQLRRKISYCPAHAKAAILEIKNSIFERMGDVIRANGPTSYMSAVAGVEGGVDFTGRNMTSFIGTEIIPELLVVRRVGVYIDKDALKSKRTKADERGVRPYLYVYKAEDIISWSYNRKNQLVSVLLRTYVDEIDENTGLLKKVIEEYRLLRKTDKGVTVQEYSIKNPKKLSPVTLLSLSEIPFVMFEMKESLMADIADYQIGLLNLASSDLGYLLKSNFPFYTEQTNPLGDNANQLRQGIATIDESGKPVVTMPNTDTQVEVGATKGRRYPKGTERPGFINPSAEPMDVSMRKQTAMMAEIRQLVQLALTNLAPTRASGESKQVDKQGLEAGLAHIGLILETGENKIAKIWAEYDGAEPAIVAYPDDYSLTTDSERLDMAEKLSKNLYKVPSLAFQKCIAKRIVTLSIGRGTSLLDSQKMIREIDAAEIIAVDPQILLKDLEAGLVATDTASKARGYPIGDVVKAKKEHIARLAAIAIAQSKGAGSNAARGVATGNLDDSAEEEKRESQSADKQPAGKGKGVRGDEE